MNYLSLALKFGPWIACAILAVFLYTTHVDLSASRDKVTSLSADLKKANGSLALYATALTDRDATIRLQNASVENLKKLAAKNRADYELALAAAQKRAYGEQQQADALLALTAPQGEVAQCRAARDLLEAELVGPGK